MAGEVTGLCHIQLPTSERKWGDKWNSLFIGVVTTTARPVTVLWLQIGRNGQYLCDFPVTTCWSFIDDLLGRIIRDKHTQLPRRQARILSSLVWYPLTIQKAHFLGKLLTGAEAGQYPRRAQIMLTLPSPSLTQSALLIYLIQVSFLLFKK